MLRIVRQWLLDLVPALPDVLGVGVVAAHALGIENFSRIDIIDLLILTL